MPVFHATVWVVVANDIHSERMKYNELFGDPGPDDDYSAMASWSYGRDFGLFFRRGRITRRVVAHEIFHVTHRIMEWIGDKFDSKHHEPYALLNGHLTEEVTEILNSDANRK